jgi:hypothetical protein
MQQLQQSMQELQQSMQKLQQSMQKLQHSMQKLQHSMQKLPQSMQQSMQQCACSRVRALFLRSKKKVPERFVHAATEHARAATELQQCVRALFLR